MQTAWDKRYQEWGSSLRAAMCKQLPELLNRYLHLWELESIEQVVARFPNARFLDAGSGYGRLSLPLTAHYPTTCAFGVDDAGSSIALFNQSLQGRGFGSVAEITHLPFADESFDIALMVTVLMYLVEPEKQRAAIGELARVTRHGGKIILIENNRYGAWTFALFGRLSRLIPRKTATDFAIPGVTFTEKQIIKLLDAADLTVTRRTGCPVFTQFLPVWFGLARMSEPLCALALRLCRRLDTMLQNVSGVSLYVCYEIDRPD